MPLQQSRLQSHTGQRLAGRGGCRWSHSRVFQVAKFVTGTGSLGLDVVHHGSYTAPTCQPVCPSPQGTQYPCFFTLSENILGV